MLWVAECISFIPAATKCTFAITMSFVFATTFIVCCDQFDLKNFLKPCVVRTRRQIDVVITSWEVMRKILSLHNIYLTCVPAVMFLVH